MLYIPATLPVPPAALTIPLPFLSSETVGWDGMLVRAFHEPARLDGWTDPNDTMISLILVLSGAMHLEVRNSYGGWHGWHVQAGDLFLKTSKSAGNATRWQSLTPEPLQTLQVHLERGLVERTAAEMDGRRAARRAIVGRSAFQDPLLTQISLALLHELDLGAPGGIFYAQTAAQMLTVHLLQHYSTAIESKQAILPMLTTRQLQRVYDYIHDALDQALTLDLLAQQVGFSPAYFARAFRHATGKSPHQYVVQQRLARAQALLSASDLPLTTIALACGFAHHSHLSHVFKQHLGCSPRVYRLAQHNSADL